MGVFVVSFGIMALVVGAYCAYRAAKASEVADRCALAARFQLFSEQDRRAAAAITYPEDHRRFLRDRSDFYARKAREYCPEGLNVKHRRDVVK